MYNKAVIITAKDVQDEEFLYPYYRLQEAGFDLDVCLVGTGDKGKYGIPIRPVPGKSLIESSQLQNQYDIVIIPGGWAPELVRMDVTVTAFIKKEFHYRTSIIGAICHGPQVLISAMICDGLVMSGYIGIADDITNAGAIYTPNIAVSETVVTAAHYRDNPIWMKTILEEHNKRVLETYVVH